MKKLTVLDHPLIQHKLSIIRDKNTGSKEFREVVGEISMLMSYEATRDLPLCDVSIETPLASMKGRMISGKNLAVVPILRAGLGMVEGVLRLIPTAKTGHIGLYRDPDTLQPIEYYCKLPDDIGERDVIILDPMLATGGSACAAVEYIRNLTKKSLKIMCIVAAPEGIKKVHSLYPQVDIFCAAVDAKLNEDSYIIPGLGDAGDRIFGTK